MLLHKSSIAVLAAVVVAASNITAAARSDNGRSDLAAIGLEVCEAPMINPPKTLPKPPGTAWYAPAAPVFPYPKGIAERALLDAYAQCLSDGLTGYIRAWRAGKAPAEIPEALIPWGTNRKDFKRFVLVDPASTPAADQWVVRPAHKIDPSALYGGFPDPNATYLVAPALLAPFGSTLRIDGSFPHARYFSAQATVPFSLDTHRYDQGVGAGEVTIVDADIEPLPGHTNPFRIGADRSARRRGYALEFEMTRGDAVALNPSFRPPHFRGAGNRRKAAGLVFQGPWGHPKSGGHKRGLFGPGQLWLRYYAPDRGKGPLAGAPLPRLTFTLPTGETFFIAADTSGIVRRTEARRPIGDDAVAAPERSKFMTEEFGWVKQAGIFESIVGGIALGTKGGGRRYVNELVRGVAARGDDAPPPGDYDQSATSATHIDYLVRGMALERDHVAVLIGKLPTFPDTRGGARRMVRAEARYWSITGYHVPRGFDFLSALLSGDPQGLASQSIMDDEVLIDSQRRFMIVFSRDDERPRNATAANGVTWVDWGASAEISWTLRWLSVGPEWKADFAPSPENLGARSDYWSRDFEPNATFRNNRRGELGEHLPRIRYMSRAAFEALGAPTPEMLDPDP